MKLKKKKKSVGLRGTHTHSRGFKKKARGSGHRGGIGKSGTGKRADHKKGMYTVKGEDYFKKRPVLGKKKIIKLKTMNLARLLDKDTENEINLKGFKLVGKSDVGKKLKISVDQVSKGARESVEKAGGEVILISEGKKIRNNNSETTTK
jgi:large subunit ribosomal protein L15